MKRMILSVLMVVSLVAQADGNSSVPRYISYQGVVRDGSGVVVPDDDYDFTFRIYSVSTGGTALWTETQTLPVSGGIVGALIGLQTTLDLDFDVQYWLGVEIDTEGEMTPRIQLAAAPYALRAAVADSVAGMGAAPGDITAVNAGPGLTGGGDSGDVTVMVLTLPGSGLSVDPVDGISIEPGGVTTDRLAAEAVTSEKLATGAVASSNLAGEAVTNDKLATGAVGSTNLMSSAVTNDKLASDAVGSGNIINSSVTNSKLGDLSVDGAKLDADAVTSAKIQDASISFGDMGQNSATTGQVMKWNGSAWAAADDIQGSGTISGVYGNDGLEGGGSSGTVYLSIADDSVTTDKLNDGAVTTAKLDDDAVTSAKIQDAAVSFGDMAQNGAATGQVMKWNGSSWAAADDLDSGGTLQGVYGTGGLEGGGTTGTVYLSIADDSVTTARLNDGAVTEAKIADLNVTTAKLDDDAVTSAKIQDAAVSFGDIGQNGAAAGQVMKWNGSAWAAADDNEGGGGSGGWTDDGDVVRLTTSADSVGIGTAAPEAKLHVAGNVIGEGSAAFGNNLTVGSYAFAAGENNDAEGSHSTVGGGIYNQAIGFGSVIGGGGHDMPPGHKAAGDFSTIGGGRENRTGWEEAGPVYHGDYATVGGGGGNTAFSAFSTVGGGDANSAGQMSGPDPDDGVSATVAGGSGNVASYAYSFIGGGFQNIINGAGGAMAGGKENQIDFEWGFIGGGMYNRLMARNSVIGGGGGTDPVLGNTVHGQYCFIGGGTGNTAGQSGGSGEQYEYIVICGGDSNVAGDKYCTIGGGRENSALHMYGTIGGGSNNTVMNNGTVAGGTGNYAGNQSTIGGGTNNRAEAGGTVGGGTDNRATGQDSAIPGGAENSALGRHSVSMGALAKAHHDGSIVISAYDIVSSSDSVWTGDSDQIVMRARNGFYLTDQNGQAPSSIEFLDTSTGAYLNAAGQWRDASDRDLKENFTAVDGVQILDKIEDLPVTEWNYKIEGEEIKHIGPTAQDFYEAFRLGDDEKTIATLDEAGVSLAAIQELYKRSQAQGERIEELEKELEELRDLVKRVLEEKK